MSPTVAAKRTPRRPRSRLTAAQIEALFAALAAANPRPTTELSYSNPFELLVAVLLSAQSTDVGVNKATRGLFAAAPTPEAMLALGEDGVCEHIRSLGLYRSKARHLIATCALLLERHGGTVPADRAALEALPGVGRKTANVVLNTAFGHETFAVDTHIFRVANRTGLAPGKSPLAVETLLERVVPAPYRRDAHHWLILHGRYICKARKPACDRCPIAAQCRWEDKRPPAGG
jgi:endonuclease-3